MKRITGLPAWIGISAFLMLMLFVAKTYVTANKKFEVVYSAETQIAGYEKSPAAVRVYASPHIKMAEVPFAPKLLGWILWISIAVVGYWVGSDKYLGNKQVNSPNEGEWKKYLIWLPVVLCAIVWFASYSASMDQGSLVTTAENLVNMYGIPQSTLDKVISHEIKNISDEKGLLTAYFTGK